MVLKIVLLMTFLCGLVLVNSENDYGRDETWEYLQGIPNEDDYDNLNYVRDMDVREPEKVDRSLQEYLEKAAQNPKFRSFQGRRYRETYPKRFEENCPPGYRTDRLGMCREIW